MEASVREWTEVRSRRVQYAKLSCLDFMSCGIEEPLKDISQGCGTVRFTQRKMTLAAYPRKLNW